MSTVSEYSQWRINLQRFKKNYPAILGSIILVFILLVAAFAPLIAPYPEDARLAVHFDKAFKPPSFEHFFGTDHMGRDVLSRIIMGTRISLGVGTLVLIIAISVGTPLGLVAGYYRGIWETIILRVSDLFLSIPALVFALSVCALIKPSLWIAIGAISFRWWAWFCRLAYGETLSIKEEGYIEVAESLGASSLYIMAKEILPNIRSTIIVKGTLDIGYAILTASALGFLGMGAQPPTPEWGTIASEGRHYLPDNWWISTFSGFALFFTVISFNLLGDGLRDLFDVELEYSV